MNLQASNKEATLQTNNNLIQESLKPLIQGSRQLTFVGTRSGEGYFSTNGQWMIFQSERQNENPFYQIYLMDLKSGKTHKVSQDSGKTTCAWIHPNLKKVLYSSTHLDPDFKKKVKEEEEKRKNPIQGKYSWGFDEYFDIYETDFYGKNIKRLTNSLGYDAESSYSPDGRWIAFASNRNGFSSKLTEEDQKKFNQDPSYMMDIFIMKSDGSDVRQLTMEKGYDGGPFFSPDGKRITWRRFTPEGDKAEIYTMNVDGSDVKKITDLKSMSWAPFYHPSGDYLIFGSSVLGYSNFELFIVDAEGKQKPIRITQEDGFDGLPVFTPDGKKLFWSRSPDKKQSQIYIADWDDILARKLLNLKPKLSVQDLEPKITAEDIHKEIYYLSDKDFAGRKTGSPEEKVYTLKIQELFKSWGLKPFDGSYLQTFEYTSGVKLGPNNKFSIEAMNLKVLEDYTPLSLSKNGSLTGGSLVFAGYGIRAPAKDKIQAYDSYKDLNVQGKWVLLLNDIPQDVPAETRLHLMTYARSQHKLSIAKNEGAVGVIFVNGPLTLGKEDFSNVKYD
ncbi:MAG TPA: biopolymer transporter Tol, partial [Pseudobdellovibrionaceae bacterium]|nr:biopolymer transporter Tol [Pseudobdellovibrionaceae bacterium]